MITFLSKRKKALLITADILLIPALIFCEWLSDRMLAYTSVCQWTLLGGQCVTCGGTHFVNSLLNGHIAEAYFHNEFLFLLTVFFLLCYILLHLHWLCGLSFAKKALGAIYSVPAAILFGASILIFFFIRNIPVLIAVAEHFF